MIYLNEFAPIFLIIFLFKSLGQNIEHFSIVAIIQFKVYALNLFCWILLNSCGVCGSLLDFAHK